jgi:peptidoglycan/xylan/chitin deacetylase (PgdA/CDA1 family)
MSQSVPILMYHLVSPRQVRGFEKYNVSPNKFAAQLTWLVRMGYTTVTLDALIDARHGHRGLPAQAVVITFDDGYRDCVVHALPVLRDLGLSAVMFLVAGLVGRTSKWLVEDRGVEEIPLLHWSDAERLRGASVQCGSHALTHTRLPALSPSACRYELEESRRLLGDRLGYTVEHVSFPHGAYDAVTQEAARNAGYRSACSVRRGLSAPDDDLFALHRVPINGHDTLSDFICKLCTGLTIGELANQSARALWWAGKPRLVM